ncbi:hypothetical protein [Breoghania sp.]|uniref:hypothetical protein n=1 Tax=Breoghania sp. TaxID=2065378 RepID=UPI002AA8264A|nr:hypothetical protein [Breoghania sp.]
MEETTEIETPLDYAVRVLAGGVRAEFARLIGVNRATVSCWASESRRAHGMAGTIPQGYIAKCLEIAREQEKPIELQRLVCGVRAPNDGEAPRIA